MTLDLPTSSRSSLLRPLALILLGLVAGAGGAAYFLRSPSAPATPAATQKYQCPMHPQIIQDHPGDCPICGMKLVPIEGSAAKTSEDRGRILFYRSPMNPSVTSPTPRKDEMGMDYVPVYERDLQGEGPTAAGRAAVVIDPERQQLIGLKTTPVIEGNVSGSVRTVGKVAVDETRVRKVNVKVDGFIEKLYVDYVGMPVAKGSPLFSLYSPDFVSAQREYLLALRTASDLSKGEFRSNGDALVAAARERLRLWDVPEGEIERLAKSGQVQKDLLLRSPVSGVVTAKMVVQGSRVGPGDAPFEITDLSHIWVQADLYETDLPKVKVGDRATFTAQAVPGRTFQGRVAFIDPVLDPKTRTAKARLEFANPRGDLKPELFGEAVIQGHDRKGILVPADAVMDTGTQKVAFVSLGEGRFEPRVVTTGATSGEQVQILTGLEPGEQVVTGASFLVDSESRLRAALAQMAPQTASPKAPEPGKKP
ncbi:MAG TPA: efflux RND transporter periplasmic adaptor subunit [Holophagaceae bacterium]